MPPLANLSPLACGGGAALFLWYHACLCHKPWYHRSKPRGSANFRPGSNPSHEGHQIQITQADSVLSTPPTNTSAIDHPMMFPPRDPTRRRFLAVAAVASIAGAGSLAAATLAPSLSVPAVLSDPAFALIDDKRAADIAHGEAIDAEAEAEEHGIGLDE